MTDKGWTCEYNVIVGYSETTYPEVVDPQSVTLAAYTEQTPIYGDNCWKEEIVHETRVVPSQVRSGMGDIGMDPTAAALMLSGLLCLLAAAVVKAIPR